MTSRGVVMTSRVVVMTSRVVVMTSRGVVMTSHYFQVKPEQQVRMKHSHMSLEALKHCMQHNPGNEVRYLLSYQLG